MVSLPEAIAARLRDPLRLDAVARTGLIDTPAEEPFDRLARLAALTLDTPHAFVTVVDAERCFWKAAPGADPAGPRGNAARESFCQYVIGLDAEFVIPDTAADPRTRDNPSIASLGVAAWAGFPLRAPDGQAIGAFCAADSRPREWTDRDTEILRTLADAASGEIALRAAVEETATLARTLQATLLPPVVPVVPGLEVGTAYLAGERGGILSGDFYDVFEGAGHQWNVVLGDVSGKGVEAARMTGLARYTLRAGAMRDTTPSAVLRLLDDAIQLEGAEDGRFVTAILAALEPTSTGFEGTVSCAGHPPALLRRADGETTELAAPGGVLGAFESVQLTDRLFQLEAGDLLVLYTDGVLDAREPSGDRYSGERLLEVVAAAGGDAQAAADAVLAAVTTHGGATLADDVAVVALRVPPAS